MPDYNAHYFERWSVNRERNPITVDPLVHVMKRDFLLATKFAYWQKQVWYQYATLWYTGVFKNAYTKCMHYPYPTHKVKVDKHSQNEIFIKNNNVVIEDKWLPSVQL